MHYLINGGDFIGPDEQVLFEVITCCFLLGLFLSGEMRKDQILVSEIDTPILLILMLWL